MLVKLGIYPSQINEETRLRSKVLSLESGPKKFGSEKIFGPTIFVSVKILSLAQTGPNRSRLAITEPNRGDFLHEDIFFETKIGRAMGVLLIPRS